MKKLTMALFVTLQVFAGLAHGQGQKQGQAQESSENIMKLALRKLPKSTVITQIKATKSDQDPNLNSHNGSDGAIIAIMKSRTSTAGLRSEPSTAGAGPSASAGSKKSPTNK
jgi:hypothetical protein